MASDLPIALQVRTRFGPLLICQGGSAKSEGKRRALRMIMPNTCLNDR
jgi:hypothetical protein